MNSRQTKALAVSMLKMSEAAIALGKAQAEYAEQLYEIATEKEKEERAHTVVPFLKIGRKQ